MLFSSLSVCLHVPCAPSGTHPLSLPGSSCAPSGTHPLSLPGSSCAPSGTHPRFLLCSLVGLIPCHSQVPPVLPCGTHPLSLPGSSCAPSWDSSPVTPRFLLCSLVGLIPCHSQVPPASSPSLFIFPVLNYFHCTLNPFSSHSKTDSTNLTLLTFSLAPNWLFGTSRKKGNLEGELVSKTIQQ